MGVFPFLPPRFRLKVLPQPGAGHVVQAGPRAHGGPAEGVANHQAPELAAHVPAQQATGASPPGGKFGVENRSA